jgi:hypothetical protein
MAGRTGGALMVIWRREREIPALPPRDLLDLLGAVPFSQIGIPREGDCYVYGLDDADGVCFYIGLSESLYTRLGVWHTKYGDYLAGIRVLQCRDATDMEVTENFLIYRMQPLENTLGTETEDRKRRARARKAPRPYTRPGRGGNPVPGEQVS